MSPTAIAAGKYVSYYCVADALTSLFLSAPVSSSTILLDLTEVSVSIAFLIVGILLFKNRENIW